MNEERVRERQSMCYGNHLLSLSLSLSSPVRRTEIFSLHLSKEEESWKRSSSQAREKMKGHALSVFFLLSIFVSPLFSSTEGEVEQFSVMRQKEIIEPSFLIAHTICVFKKMLCFESGLLSKSVRDVQLTSSYRSTLCFCLCFFYWYPHFTESLFCLLISFHLPWDWRRQNFEFLCLNRFDRGENVEGFCSVFRLSPVSCHVGNFSVRQIWQAGRRPFSRILVFFIHVR